MKPSEMVAGLDEVAKRAEKMEEREAARRRAGGKMNANEAMLVDDTGRRWKRLANTVVGVAIAAVVIGGALLMYFANRQKIDVRTANDEARRMVLELSMRVGRLNLPAGETVTAEGIRRQLLEQIGADLKRVREDLKPRPGHDPKYKSPSPHLQKERDWLGKMETLKDAWGQPFVFEMVNADTLKIAAKGKAGGKSEPPEAVTVRLRGSTQTPEKTDRAPEKGEQ